MLRQEPVIYRGSANCFLTKTIKLQTREGNDVENFQLFALSPFEKKDAERIRQKWSGKAVEFRCGDIPVYNCHGLTFASRRTRIWNSDDLRKILKDDRYDEVVDRAEVLPGDIILYFTDTGDIEHSGIVVSKPDGPLLVPRVLSKWGSGCEAIHPANNCPYKFSLTKYYRVRE